MRLGGHFWFEAEGFANKSAFKIKNATASGADWTKLHSSNRGLLSRILAKQIEPVYKRFKFPLIGGLTTARHGRGGRRKGYVHVYTTADAKSHCRLACR
jgi:hypothetical protein